ncbi:MAG TPA: DUF979 domain-containing protein [Rhizomicrobium sp.]|jgi:uncharacterized membrane protein|nr:DUF979 domain-containing protein [Rhizomicrobium sp.]
MITLQFCYLMAGLAFGSYAVLSAFDHRNRKRFGNAAFWGLFASSFLFGSYLADWQNGLLVLALIVLGGCRLLGHGKPSTTSPKERRESATLRGNWLFAPALLVPAVALLGTLFLKQAQIGGSALLDPKSVTVISLVLGVVIALGVAMLWLRPKPLAPLQEGRRLADMIGWAIILPQLLASLGAIFALSGVGKAVGEIATRYLPLDQPFEAVLVYCIGMAAFTAVMGNAFAAFPVMTAGIGLPLIVHQFHGNAAIMAAIGMLSGFCGTLTTPMAANFNIVPAVLLELPDRNGVIKVQLPTAGLMLIANTLLMYALVYRF